MRRPEDEDRPLADRRADPGDAVPDDEHDFAEENAPGPTSPANAPADAPGGEDEGYSPQTEVP